MSYHTYLSDDDHIEHKSAESPLTMDQVRTFLAIMERETERVSGTSSTELDTEPNRTPNTIEHIEQDKD